jgi:acyl carrier protein
MDETIRSVLYAEANLLCDPGTIGEDVDLYEQGMTSHATVNVMLALEDAFDLEFPEHLLRKDTFSSIGVIRTVLQELTLLETD